MHVATNCTSSGAEGITVMAVPNPVSPGWDPVRGGHRQGDAKWRHYSGSSRRRLFLAGRRVVHSRKCTVQRQICTDGRSLGKCGEVTTRNDGLAESTDTEIKLEAGESDKRL